MRWNLHMSIARMNRSRSRFAALVLVAALGVICLYYSCYISPTPYFHPLTLRPCQPTVLDPFDAVAIGDAPRRPAPLVHCDKLELDIVHVDGTQLVINRTELASSNLTRSSIKCAYRYMAYTSSNSYTTSSPVLIVDERTDVHGDYINVQCRHGPRLMQDAVFAIVYTKDKPTPTPNSVDKPSVLFIGLDSMSRSNFIRLFNESHDYLTNTMNAVDFELHTKIYDNTFVNVLALNSGQDIPFYKRGWMDSWTEYIWERFHEHGYISMFTEDFVINRMYHTYYPLVNFVGFSRQPTHFYDFAYWKYADDKNMTQYYADDGGRAGIKYNMSCTGTKATFDLHMNYLSDFQKAYTGQRTFAFFWSSEETHDELDYGHVLDANLTQLLRSVRQSSTNTITIVLSDHGFRWGAFRRTKLGRRESRNPMLFVAMSDDLQRARPDWMANLRANARRMTTVYDIYRMLQVLVEDAPDEDIKRRMEEESNVLHRRLSPLELTPRGTSLLHSRISRPRSCASVGVPMEYCPCVDDRPSSTNVTIIHAIARAVIRDINARLDDKAASLCATNSIANITADVDVTPMGKIDDVADYSVRLTMQPNSALIETSVTMDDDGEVVIRSQTFERLDRYGTTSHCVVGDLRTICYCKTQLKT